MRSHKANDIMFSDSQRIKLEDKKIDGDVSNVALINHLFVRCAAKARQFTNVDFKYSIFDTCYLRGCSFNSCDFTGCRFIGTSLHGSSFTGCKFDYAIFERTIVANDLLDTSCPGTENLTMRFARTLRMNYQQLGDIQSANKAMKVELAATEVHLHKAWRSKEAYYRHKYKGWKRVEVWGQWVGFKVLDSVWGNGETVGKLLRAVLIVLVLMFLCGLAFGDPTKGESYGSAFFRTPAVFLGTATPNNYPQWYLTIVLMIRLIAFGFFMSVIIRRFSRR